jgi:hypothetical protein
LWQQEHPSQSNADCIIEVEEVNCRLAAANLALGLIVSKLRHNVEHSHLLMDIKEYVKLNIEKDKDINNLNLQLNEALSRENKRFLA